MIFMCLQPRFSISWPHNTTNYNAQAAAALDALASELSGGLQPVTLLADVNSADANSLANPFNKMFQVCVRSVPDQLAGWSLFSTIFVTFI